MMDTTDTNFIGIDPAYWKVMWEGVNTGYDMIHFLDSLSPNQLESKYWLVETLSCLVDREKLKVQLLGGWFGFPLVDILLQHLDIEYLQNIDIDDKALHIYRMFKESRKPHRLDCQCIDACTPYKLDKDMDIVINTSSEHMPDLKEIRKNKDYKKDCLFAIQSNNMFHVEDHINCVNNEAELIEKSGLTDIQYSGKLEMPNGYERYMVIGYA